MSYLPRYEGRLYAHYRPTYPQDLIDYLVSLCKHKDNAWDVCTGTGAVATMLADRFHHVIASDNSLSQLQNAHKRSNIDYRREEIERTAILPQSLDLITVAQAFHWLDAEGFLNQVSNLLKADGILAVWHYSYCLDENIEALTKEYLNYLRSDDKEEGKMIDKIYAGYHIAHPDLKFIRTDKHFFSEKNWRLSDYLGYLKTISLPPAFDKNRQQKTLQAIANKAQVIWRDEIITISWPIHLQVFKRV